MKLFSSTAPEFFSEKSLKMPKKLKGGTLWSRPVLYVTRETLLLVELFRSLQVHRKQ